MYDNQVLKEYHDPGGGNYLCISSQIQDNVSCFWQYFLHTKDITIEKFDDNYQGDGKIKV